MDNTLPPLKRIAAIHDLSGLGKCSLTVALPVISATGVVVVLNILLMLTDNNKRATMATMGMTVSLTVAVMVHLCIVAMFNDQVMQRRSLHFQAELEQQRASSTPSSWTPSLLWCLVPRSRARWVTATSACRPV